MLATSPPENAYPASEILALYRLRWPIELAFKKNGRHALAGLPRRAVFGRLAGYEDVVHQANPGLEDI
jgi:hypothetical protein